MTPNANPGSAFNLVSSRAASGGPNGTLPPRATGKPNADFTRELSRRTQSEGGRSDPSSVSPRGGDRERPSRADTAQASNSPRSQPSAESRGTSAKSSSRSSARSSADAKASSGDPSERSGRSERSAATSPSRRIAPEVSDSDSAVDPGARRPVDGSTSAIAVADESDELSPLPGAHASLGEPADDGKPVDVGVHKELPRQHLGADPAQLDGTEALETDVGQAAAQEFAQQSAEESAEASAKASAVELAQVQVGQFSVIDFGAADSLGGEDATVPNPADTHRGDESPSPESDSEFSSFATFLSGVRPSSKGGDASEAPAGPSTPGRTEAPQPVKKDPTSHALAGDGQAAPEATTPVNSPSTKTNAFAALPSVAATTAESAAGSGAGQSAGGGGGAAAESAAGRTTSSAFDRLASLHSLSGPAMTDVKSAAAEVPQVAAPYTDAERFSGANATSIVSGVRSQMLSGGGKMTLRLDPPELGAVQVSVVMKDGLASVAFSTDNAESARLISSTLSQLRESLSAAGLSVDRLSVQQTPKAEAASRDSDARNPESRSSSQQYQSNEDGSRRDQQRRDLLERMWRRAAGDDVSLFA